MRREAMVCITTVAFTLTILVAQRTATQYQWDLPPGVPPPRLPVDTPMTAERVELGRYLFYDTRLSGNGTQSCATCHIQALAFTDGRSRAVGSTGERHPRPTGTRPASKNWSRPDTSRWPWPRYSGRSSPSGALRPLPVRRRPEHALTVGPRDGALLLPSGSMRRSSSETHRIDRPGPQPGRRLQGGQQSAERPARVPVSATRASTTCRAQCRIRPTTRGSTRTRGTGGRRPVPDSNTPQRRRDGALYARRQHRRARRGAGSLRRRGPGPPIRGIASRSSR